MELTLTAPAAGPVEGTTEPEPVEPDAFIRLDAGYFNLEMCSGTARGTGASKWGLRHFATLKEGIDLLPSGNNAIGGFYGPFFTPKNGLINPPQQTGLEPDQFPVPGGRAPFLERHVVDTLLENYSG